MAGAIIGGAFLSASLQVLFDRLASREVLSFFRGHKLSDALLKKLQRKLPILQAVLDDAEVKQIRSPSIKKWVELLKDAVYDAEDVLDEINTEVLRCKVEAAESQISSSQACNSISTWINPSFDGQNLEARLQEIIDRLEDIIQDKDVLGLEKVICEKPSQRWPSTSSVDESVVYGRVDEKQKIIELLLSDNSSGNSVIDVITIVGMGGSGKTTLAQLLYNDDMVKKHFDLKVWVCVSEEFDLIKVTKAILEGIDSSTPETDNLDVLQLKLKERVNMKKFLLILDDVWDEDFNNWDRLKTPLLVGAKGSKIIVTTRIENVAVVMDAIHIQHLQELSPDDCWSLFANRALRNRSSTVYRQLEPIGKKIVAKCKGLPLAVNAVGNLLRSKKEASEWEDVLNSDMWDLSNKILPALRLSYYYLPSQLKQCFAYCSIFPKDYVFEKEKLILLWMAEGFLQQQGNKRMEKVGERYFDELLSKSFFHGSIKNESCFVMHDLFNDLARLVCGEFFAWLEDAKMLKLFEKARHLSYFMLGYDTFDKFKTVTEVKYLRTFLPLNMGSFFYNHLSNRVLHHLLPEMRCLRVLFLHHYLIADLPDSIGKLKHLRYLDLSFTIIRKLPESICALCNLQTLILLNCHSFVALPSRMGKLINLRYLDISGTQIKEMPSDICNLKSLQVLTDFVVGEKSGARIGQLRDLSDISGGLHISEMENVGCDKDALSANMKDKKHLDELELEWSFRQQFMDDDKDILSKLQPHPNLKRLKITNYGGSRFPDWVGDVSVFFNLVSVTLHNCGNCSSLPPLGQLSSLKHLCISGIRVENVGNEFYGNSSSLVKPSFPSLQTLRLEYMWKWKKWLCCGGRRGELPRLEELYMKDCPILIGKLPKQLRSLKKLEIVGCPQLLMASLRVPAICESEMKNCGKLLLKRPRSDFTYSQASDIEISNISQWKEVPQNQQTLSIRKCDSVETLMERMMEMNTCLIEHLVIGYCSFSRSLLRVGLPTNTLRTLRIIRSIKLEFLLPELLRCHHPLLEHLYIQNGTCDFLSLSFSVSMFPRLTDFQIVDIEGLEFLTISLSEEDQTSLRSLHIQDCPDLVHIELPAVLSANYSIGHCSKLRILKHTSSSLKSLDLSNCPELLFHRDGLPSSLLQLQISSCYKLTSQVDWGLQRLASLTHFTIGDRCLKVESFPEEWLLPSTLTHLEIRYFPNLKSLSSKGLQHLTSLQHLYIADCPALESLTEDGLQHLISLEQLQIYNCHKLQYLTKQGLPNALSCLTANCCPLLEYRCQFMKGPDWHYIAQIPHIVINNVMF